jgi:hypothetical protein
MVDCSNQPCWSLLLQCEQGKRRRPATWLEKAEVTHRMVPPFATCATQLPSWARPLGRWLSIARRRLRLRALAELRMHVLGYDDRLEPSHVDGTTSVCAEHLRRSDGALIDAVASTLWEALLQTTPTQGRLDDAEYAAWLRPSTVAASTARTQRTVPLLSFTTFYGRIRVALCGQEAPPRAAERMYVTYARLEMMAASTGVPFEPCMTDGAPPTQLGFGGFVLFAAALADFWCETTSLAERLAFLRELTRALGQRPSRTTPPATVAASVPQRRPRAASAQFRRRRFSDPIHTPRPVCAWQAAEHENSHSHKSVAQSSVWEAHEVLRPSRGADAAASNTGIMPAAAYTSRAPQTVRVALHCFLTPSAVHRLSAPSASTVRAQREQQRADDALVASTGPLSPTKRASFVVAPPTMSSRMFVSAAEAAMPKAPKRHWSSASGVRRPSHSVD